MSRYTPPRITQQQMRCIYALGHKAAMDNDTLHALIHKYTGCESVKVISQDQAMDVIKRLKSIVGQQYDDDRSGRATNKQLGLIRGIAGDMGWDNDRLRKFCDARFGISHLNFLDVSTARKVIEALKAMQRGGRGERERENEHAIAGLDKRADA